MKIGNSALLSHLYTSWVMNFLIVKIVDSTLSYWRTFLIIKYLLTAFPMQKTIAFHSLNSSYEKRQQR